MQLMYSVENIVKQLVKMGFEKDLIISTIKRIRLTNGMYPYTDFFTICNVLVNAIYILLTDILSDANFNGFNMKIF